MCGIRAENEGGVTATAFIAAACLGSTPRRMRHGNRRKPGPTPRRPDNTEMGIAKSSANR
jgi:hypothetical protein